MVPDTTLRKNLAPWDRALRMVTGAGLVLVAALALPAPGPAALVGALGGAEVFTGWVGH